MIDLDARLRQGPLKVRTLWSADRGENVVRQILRRRRQLFALDVAVAVCACAMLVLFGVRRAAAPVPSLVAAVEPKGRVASFADGSVAELWTREAEIRIEEDNATRTTVRLMGGARFHIVPNRQHTFQVQAGDVRVRVVGTIFSMQQVLSGQSQVLVEQGRVEVAWLGGVAMLQAGEGGVFPPTESPRPAETAQPSAAEPRISANGSRGEGVAPRRTWRDYALRGEYERAYGELHSSSTDAPHEDAADLMLEADVARLSGHPDQAVVPLRTLCERHASDRRAPVAAFTLGRVLLDDLGRPLEAVDSFQKARSLWPAGPLAEDALAREAEALQRAGQAGRARAVAQQYRERYPQGRHIAALGSLLMP